MKKDSQRNYNMTDAELAMYTSNLVMYMTRDATEFAARGVDGAAITALETLGNEFEVFPDNAYYEADVMLAAQEKNAHRDNCEVEIRAIMACAKIEWGDQSPQVKRFNAGSMTRVNDREFLTIARQVHLIGTEYLSDLTSVGLTQAMLDNLQSEAQSMEDAMNDIAEKEAIRDIKTNERIDKGNELYSYVARYCEIGKIIWQDIDEARYNDYVIYANSPELPGKILNLAYDETAGALSWDANVRATTYEMQYAPDQPTPIFTTVYEGPATTYTYDPGGPDNYLFRVRGKNEYGSGEWSDVLTVDR